MGAYYQAKHTVTLQHRVHILEDSYKEATEHIVDQEKTIVLLQQELDFIRRTEEERAQRNEPKRSWNPSNLMEMGNRQ